MKPEELNFENETRKHKLEVAKLLSVVTQKLLQRGIEHDDSKFQEPERGVFIDVTAKLRELTYGSVEYKEQLSKMKPALDHHYAVNAHHPDGRGLEQMNLLDIIEMFCDWLAATLRHKDGDIIRSIKVNQERFNISPQLVAILTNTVGELSK